MERPGTRLTRRRRRQRRQEGHDLARLAAGMLAESRTVTHLQANLGKQSTPGAPQLRGGHLVGCRGGPRRQQAAVAQSAAAAMICAGGAAQHGRRWACWACWGGSHVSPGHCIKLQAVLELARLHSIHLAGARSEGYFLFLSAGCGLGWRCPCRLPVPAAAAAQDEEGSRCGSNQCEGHRHCNHCRHPAGHAATAAAGDGGQDALSLQLSCQPHASVLDARDLGSLECVGRGSHCEQREVAS